MELDGITLLKYIPNYAWVAKLTISLDVLALEKHNVRHIADAPSDWKMSKDMFTTKVNDLARKTTGKLIQLNTPTI